MSCFCLHVSVQTRCKITKEFFPPRARLPWFSRQNDSGSQFTPVHSFLLVNLLLALQCLESMKCFIKYILPDFLSGYDKNEYPCSCSLPDHGSCVSVLLLCSSGIVLVCCDLCCYSSLAQSHCCSCQR